ncbi:phosphatidylglycerophosphatase A family protein [Teichococcus aestuarii]|uniref:phosphatidylglycerophosphatase A family protein n=1 Tax=Teichococcus aestuarii TaxID=568898 RepID=UPI0036117233
MSEPMAPAPFPFPPPPWRRAGCCRVWWPAWAAWASCARRRAAGAPPWYCRRRCWGRRAAALAALLALLGWWAVERLPEARADPGWVVVDEGAGQCLALAALPLGAGAPGLILAFLLFRLFDIAKPGPVGWADRRKGSMGVMLDDIIAGALAAAVILALRAAAAALGLPEGGF